ncbi:hypothetical protein C2E23DRAFT_260046 [Lenzites betulinus]|nr:hypothetical protein C2E23DRAFT_260046 [Lenzites betulinus]
MLSLYPVHHPLLVLIYMLSSCCINTEHFRLSNASFSEPGGWTTACRANYTGPHQRTSDRAFTRFFIGKLIQPGCDISPRVVLACKITWTKIEGAALPACSSSRRAGLLRIRPNLDPGTPSINMRS